jgi:type IV secretion system protein TrbF
VAPYVIERSEDGRVRPQAVLEQRYEPGEKEKRFFLASWLTDFYNVDRFRTEQDLQKAFALVRGKAIQEFQDYLKSPEGPFLRLNNDNSLTRSVDISSISFLNNGSDQARSVLIRFTAEERSRAQPTADRIKRIATIHFDIVPPKTEEEILKNPIGLFVTHFEINKDLEK